MGTRLILTVLACTVALVMARASSAEIVAAAGDIASCSSRGDTNTGNMIRAMNPNFVLALGDNAYEKGRLWEYRQCYDPAWGSFKGKTFPIVGNHEYLDSSTAAGFRDYFNRDRTYYSYRIGSWRIYALNSERSIETQRTWLRNTMESKRRPCTLAYWHRPRWSDGMHGNDSSVGPLWKTFANHGGDVVLNGHDHNYQRWPLVDGVREFVVGTGGKSVANLLPAHVLDFAKVSGVLRLSLREGFYKWAFRSVAGLTLDAGQANCR